MLCWQCFSRVTANLVKFERTSVLSKRIACMIRSVIHLLRCKVMEKSRFSLLQCIAMISIWKNEND